ncbi:MAG: energy transducer TonB [Thermoanaerobaculia bacterium]
MHLQRWSGVGLALWFLAAGVAGALGGPNPAGRKEAQAVVSGFNDSLAQIDRLLSAGETAKATKQLKSLRREMIDRFMGGRGVEAYLARMSALRAIAAYQAGEPDEAIWHWHVALQLHPPISQLSFFGHEEAGAFLVEHPPRSALDEDEQGQGEAAERKPVPADLLEPPKVHKRPRPEFPWARLGTGATTPVVVRVIIGKDGSIHDPVIVESGGEPTMVYVALDSLRQWEFTPARLRGEPVDAYYALTVNFRSEW